MTLKYADRVLETTTTQGTGAVSLSGSLPGFQTFFDGVGDGAKVSYFIEDGTDWEAGIGQLTAGSPDTLSRDTILGSSNGGSAVNWGPGTRNIFLGASSHNVIWRDENGNDVNAFGAGAGTANAHTVAMPMLPRALSDGMIIRWVAPANNTTGITVNVNGLGAKPYVNADLTAFTSGMIKSGSMQEAIYIASEDKFVRTTQIIPIGTGSNDIPRNSDLGEAAFVSISEIRRIPVRTSNANTTFVLTDGGSCVVTTNTTAYTYTIPPNADVAFPIGSAITIVNYGTSGVLTIAKGTGVNLFMAADTANVNRTLDPKGMATLLKVGTNNWMISGAGLS